ANFHPFITPAKTSGCAPAAWSCSRERQAHDIEISHIVSPRRGGLDLLHRRKRKKSVSGGLADPRKRSAAALPGFRPLSFGLWSKLEKVLLRISFAPFPPKRPCIDTAC